MIERAVFSYLNSQESFDNKAGFKYFSDFLYTMALATTSAQRHFKEVNIVTTSWGENVLQAAGIPGKYSTELNDIRSISKWFWAYGKLVAYSIQKEPFVHIDNDVFLWKPLSNRVLQAQLCFQSKEYMNVPDYKWYDMLRPCWEKAPIRPQVIVESPVTDFVYNCGICGGHDLEFFDDWRKASAEYILSEENQKAFFEDFRKVLPHQNLYHEQYFAASLIQAKNIRSRVEVISDKASELVQQSNNGYTHLWGTTKNDQTLMKKVRLRLQKEDPGLFNQVTDFVNNYIVNECQKEKEILVH